MARLSFRMQAPLPWGTAEAGDNAGIPSGYTYLLQLVAHDLVETSVSMSLVQGDRRGTRNQRLSRLNLDTVYGGGPLVCPAAYAADPARPDVRSRLKLGRMRGAANEPAPAVCPFRDLPRVSADGPGDGVALTDVLIVDARNDDHALIAQLVTLFHLFHNGVLGLLSPPRGRRGSGSEIQASYDRFRHARRIVTLVYRTIIRRDLMRRILHPAVHAAYSVPRPRFIDPLSAAEPGHDTAAGQVPLEFSQGAFRFGHAMVRDKYRINGRSEHRLAAVLTHNSVLGAANMPLDPTWIVQWSHFFEIHGSMPNLSRRIGPRLSPGFLAEGIFERIDDQGPLGLAYRDLLGSTCIGLWSVSGLIDAIAKRRPDLVRLSPLLADPAERTRRLRAWLGEERRLSGLTDEDIARLSVDPPLSFFIMFEAAFEPGAHGGRLGLLGSILVAEVIFGALASDADDDGPDEPDGVLEAMLAGLPCVPPSQAARLAKIETMADLVIAVADIADLNEADPAFL